MAFLSILIALLLERITPQLIEFRRFDWLRTYNQWLIDVLHVERLGAWVGFALLLIPLLLVAWVLNAMFENAVFGLFELAFNVLVIFLCLGPKELDSQVDAYLDSIEVGDSQQRFNTASRITTEAPAMELPAQVVQVSKTLFVEANSRMFAVMFWFALFGPLAAVLYRLMEQLLRQNYLPSSLAEVKRVIRMLIGWIDWIPARISLFAYMVSGGFDEGLQAYRKGSLTSIDGFEQNNELLQQVGFASITNHELGSDSQAMEMVRKVRGLILRSLVVWLLFILLISFID